MLKKVLTISLVASVAISSLNASELKRTVQVSDNNMTSAPTTVMVANSKFYFMGQTSEYGNELWTSDGTTANTHMVADMAEGNSNSNFTFISTLGDRLIFVDNNRNLLYSDGTNTTTKYIKDNYIDENNETKTRKVKSRYYSNEHDYAKIGDKVIFSRDDVDGKGEELWSTDGTSTTLLKNIASNDTSYSHSSSPRSFYKVGDKVVFLADDRIHGNELWVTDGTTSGTKLLKDIKDGSSYATYYFMGSDASNVYFYTQYHDGDKYIYSFWKTDGTVDGTKKIITSNSKAGSIQLNTSKTRFAITDSGKIFFMASYKAYNEVSEEWESKGTELWTSDGSTAKLVKDFNLGSNGSNFDYFRTLGDKIIFRNYDNSGYHIWVSDGTVDGTKEITNKDGNSLNLSYYYSDSDRYISQEVDGKIYFYAKDETTDKFGYELYATDGTIDGTYLVKDIMPGSSSSSPEYFYSFNNEVYFWANNGSYGKELWKSDGTLLGTQMVHDVRYGSSSVSDYKYLGILNDNLYIALRDTDAYNKYSIWSTDGEITMDESMIQDINVSKAIEATKALCKSNPSACGIATVAPALSSDIVSSKSAGWHMLGTSLPVSDMSVFNSADSVWKYNGTGWSIYSPNPDLQGAIQDAGFTKLNTLEAFDGVWIRKK